MALAFNGKGSGGGAAFNGGTITGELKIDPASPGTTPLEIDTPGHAGDPAFTVIDDLAAGVFTVTDQGGVGVSGSLAVSGTTQLGATTNAVELYLLAGPAQASNIEEVYDKDGNLTFRLNKVGRVVFAVHSAPADGDLAAGDCSLWFDQTDGAAKLMVKAKTANGTVATAAIALA